MKIEGHFSDDELADLFKSGDKKAFELLFERHYALIVNVINKYTKNAATSEDLAQSVFIKLWKKRASLNIHTSFLHYIKKAAINETLNHLKANKRHIFTEPDNWESTLEDFSPQDEEERSKQEKKEHKLHNAIDALPEKCRIVFILNRFDGLSHKEIAEKLDISTKTIENHMTKALRILKDILLRKTVLLLFLFF